MEGREFIRIDEPPTAFPFGGGFTLGFMKVLTEEGKSCPHALSILTFDDFGWLNYFYPQLTAVVQPARDMGLESMRMLLAALEQTTDDGLAPRQNLKELKPELRVRESTAHNAGPGWR